MSLPEISDVQRLRLEPGDALVLHLDIARVSDAEVAQIKANVRAGLRVGEDVPVLILGAGASIEVLAGRPATDAGVPAACEGRAPAGAPVPGSPVNPAREVG